MKMTNAYTRDKGLILVKYNGKGNENKKKRMNKLSTCQWLRNKIERSKVHACRIEFEQKIICIIQETE